MGNVPARLLGGRLPWRRGAGREGGAGVGRKARPVVLPRLVCRFMAAAVVVATMAGAGGPVLNGADAGAAGLKEAAGMYEQLRAEWNRKNLNLGKCGDLLGRLKVGRGALKQHSQVQGGGGLETGIGGVALKLTNGVREGDVCKGGASWKPGERGGPHKQGLGFLAPLGRGA